MIPRGPNYRARHLPHTTSPLLLRFPKCALHVASPQSWHPWWQSAQSGLLHVWHASENWPLPESFLQSVHTSPMECDGRIRYKDQTARVSLGYTGIIWYLERRRACILPCSRHIGSHRPEPRSTTLNDQNTLVPYMKHMRKNRSRTRTCHTRRTSGSSHRTACRRNRRKFSQSRSRRLRILSWHDITLHV